MQCLNGNILELTFAPACVSYMLPLATIIGDYFTEVKLWTVNFQLEQALYSCLAIFKVASL